MRILVTGSRDWSDADTMFRALLRQPGDAQLVHGGCKGADLMADRLWKILGRIELNGRPYPEVHEAKWSEFGAAAGPIRNQRMVDLGADVCLAFPMPWSRGTWDCVRRARAAGIAVEIINAREVT